MYLPSLQRICVTAFVLNFITTAINAEIFSEFGENDVVVQLWQTTYYGDSNKITVHDRLGQSRLESNGFRRTLAPTDMTVITGQIVYADRRVVCEIWTADGHISPHFRPRKKRRTIGPIEADLLRCWIPDEEEEERLRKGTASRRWETNEKGMKVKVGTTPDAAAINREQVSGRLVQMILTELTHVMMFRVRD